ncbi:MAG: BspA family leucine-rich repeat surface protein [Polaribacter sp.]|nr:BspA family leucine-rich repeat surface protein [Polaribacter sp.]
MKKLNILKKIGFFVAVFLMIQTLNAQNEFISVWQSTNQYPSIEIPTYDAEVYNYTVDWGDGSVSNNVAGDITHNYAITGNYTVTITGLFPGINFSKIYRTGPYGFHYNQILSIEQWGNNQWKTMEGAFKGRESLVINTNQTPDLSQCTNLSEMFYNCDNLDNSTSNSWNLWNTTTITNMSSMFHGAAFNKLISNWNTSNVTDMSAMFIFTNFNQPIGTWNVAKVTNMESMFRVSEFNQDITNWNVSSVLDMSYMFYQNLVFNQPIDSWDVSNVNNMTYMFQGTRDFNPSLNSWNVGKVTNMAQMFYDSNFNGNITNWNVSEVTNMDAMFASNDNFNQPIGNWNVSKVTDMSSMFSGTNFNQDISNWNITSVTTISHMFAGNTVFNQNISNWNTENVTSMFRTFKGALAFDQNISNWNVEKVTSCFEMFDNAKLSTANYDALLIGWNAQNLQQNVSFNAGNSKYFSNAAEAARLNMTNNDNWIISDGGKIEQITWTGALSTDWNTSGNWDTNTVPTKDDNVILADVANAPKINFNQSHEVNDLTINENLTIKNNAGLTVNGNLDHGANIQVESFANGNGSFIFRGNQTNINPADLIYLRYVSGNNWHLFSSPATGIDIDVFAAATALAEGQNNNRGIGFHNNNSDPRWTYYQNGANNSGNFIEGKGYSIQTSGVAFLNFTGKLKADNLSNYPITENLDGWNLVGNPYPSNINANINADENENFLTENAAQLDPVFANLYLWNPGTTSYEPIGNGLGAKYIAPGQAFFVKSKNGGGAININKSMLTHQIGNLFLKANQPEKIVLKIDDNTNISETTIAFKNGMTLGLDTTYDAAVFSGESTNLSLYTHLLESNENVPFGIQFLPELENNDFIIPLGIAQNEASEITLSLKETSLPADQKIYIEDRVQNTFTEISNVDYKFSHQNDASETGRFFLHFQQKALNTETFTTNKIAIYKESESSVQINGAENGFLNIYTLTGKKVFEKRKIDAISKSIELPKLAKGLYLFEVKTNSRRIVKKIIF